MVQPPLPGLVKDKSMAFKRFKIFYRHLMEEKVKSSLKAPMRLLFAFSLVPYRRILADETVTEETIAKRFVTDLTKFAEAALNSHYCLTMSVAIGARPHAWEATVGQDRYARLLRRLGMEIAHDRASNTPKLPAGLPVAWSVRLEDLTGSIADALRELYSTTEGLLLVEVGDDYQLLRQVGSEDGPKIPALAAPVFIVRLVGKTVTGKDRIDEIFDALKSAGFGDQPNIIVDPIDQWWMDAAGCPPHSPFAPSPCDLQHGGLFRQFDDVHGRHCLMRKKELHSLVKRWDPADKSEVAARVEHAFKKVRSRTGSSLQGGSAEAVCTDRPLLKPREYLDLPRVMREVFSLNFRPLLTIHKSSQGRGNHMLYNTGVVTVRMVALALLVVFIVAIVISAWAMFRYGSLWMTLKLGERNLVGNHTEEEDVEYKHPTSKMIFKIRCVKADHQKRLWARAQLRGHVCWQHEVILTMYQNEFNSTKAPNVDRSALEALHKRLLGVFDISVSQSTEDYLKKLYAELVRAKVLMSMMEHTLHAPKRVQSILQGLKPITIDAGEVVVHLGSLQEIYKGLDVVHETGAINFDDMDDGELQRKNGFRESEGWWVLLDMICHLHELLTFRSWVALIAFYRVYGVAACTLSRIELPLPGTSSHPFSSFDLSWRRPKG